MSKKDNARRILKEFESLFQILSLILPLKELQNGVSTYRSIISNPQLKKWKKYPKLDALEPELVRNEPFIKNWAKTVIERDADPLNQAIQELQVQIRTFLNYPESYHEAYDDIHPKLDKDGRPMFKEQEWRDARLKEKNRAVPSGYTHETGELEDEKTLKRKYNKYVKEWNKKND